MTNLVDVHNIKRAVRVVQRVHVAGRKVDVGHPALRGRGARQLQHVRRLVQPRDVPWRQQEGFAWGGVPCGIIVGCVQDVCSLTSSKGKTSTAAVSPFKVGCTQG